MPRRTTTPFTDFGDAPNKYITLASGQRVPLEYIRQAREAMQFSGGDTPRLSWPSPTPSATGTRGDSSGTGLVNRNLFRQDNQANTDWWETSNASVAARPNLPLSDEMAFGQPPPPGPIAESSSNEWTTSPGDRRFLPQGGPTVQLPRSESGGALGMDDEPSLFGSSVSNPFDDWWRQGTMGEPSVTVNAGDGGSIWSGEQTVTNFGGDLSLGEDISADLDTLGFGSGYPDRSPTADELGLNQPPPPGPIPPAPAVESDNEWTTSPDDRRFLPSGEPVVQTPRAGRGGDITSFGTYNNPLTLGTFFGNSLESMRFGTDRYQPQITTGAEAVGGYNSSLGTYDSFDAEGNLIRTPGPPPTGSVWDTEGRENASNPAGEFNAWPRGELLSPQPPPGMRIIGHDTRNGQPIYQDANGGLHVNPGTGSRVNPAFSDPESFYAGTYFDYGTGHYQELHDPGSFRTNPNQGAEQMGRTRQTTTDAGHNQFGFDPHGMMTLNSEGGFEFSSVDRPESDPALRGWSNLVTSARGRQSAARGFPVTSSRGG